MPSYIAEIVTRRARRALGSQALPAEVLDRVMSAATLAPSCFNNQPWRFVVVHGGEALGKVKEALSSGNYWARSAPCIVAAATKPDLDCQLSDRREYALFDLGLAVENLLLQAFHEGLYAHPIAGYNPAKVKEALGVPEEYVVGTLVILGYPGEVASLNDKHRESERSDRTRKPLGEVLMRDRWGGTW